MKTIVYLFTLLFLIGFGSCDKESHRRIKYRVVSKTSFDIVYSVNGKTFTKKGEAGEWQSSYRLNVGSDYFLSALKTGPGFELTILIYSDGELLARKDTKEMWELIKLEGVVY